MSVRRVCRMTAETPAIERASEEGRHRPVVYRGAVSELVQLVLEGFEQWPLPGRDAAASRGPFPKRSPPLEGKLRSKAASPGEACAGCWCAWTSLVCRKRQSWRRRDGDGLLPPARLLAMSLRRQVRPGRSGGGAQSSLTQGVPPGRHSPAPRPPAGRKPEPDPAPEGADSDRSADSRYPIALASRASCDGSGASVDSSSSASMRTLAQEDVPHLHGVERVEGQDHQRRGRHRAAELPGLLQPRRTSRSFAGLRRRSFPRRPAAPCFRPRLPSSRARRAAHGGHRRNRQPRAAGVTGLPSQAIRQGAGAPASRHKRRSAIHQALQVCDARRTCVRSPASGPRALARGQGSLGSSAWHGALPAKATSAAGGPCCGAA